MKLLLIMFLLLLSVSSQATNYYFSSQSGDDARTSLQAQNPSTPWKTLAKLNSFFSTVQPGDSLLLKRGEIFYGYIVTTASGTAAQAITVGAYGTGERPIISGFTVLNNWVAAGPNKWETINTALTDSVNVFTLNGISRAAGRYPNPDAANGGYLTYESHTGNTQIIDNQLNASRDWTGADIVIRKNRYIIDRGKITSQAGNTLSFTGTSDYEISDSFGYFIQNHIATLDQRGEWCYDKIAKKITLFLDAAENPNGEIVKAACVNTLIQVWNKSNLHFDNITLEGANETGFDIYGSVNIQLTNCTVINSGTLAIQGNSNTSTLIDNCEVLNSNNNGIFVQNETGNTIKNCLVKNSGVFPGMGKNGENNYQAVIVVGSNNIIANNTVDSTGYTALRFEGNNIAVTNNLVQHFNFVKDDGAGIYTWTGNPSVVYTGGKITGNIVLYGIGAGKGTSDSASIATYGIYIDETAGYVDITNNTVAFCKGGLYVHNGNNLLLRNNTSYDNETQLLFHEDHGYFIHDNGVYSNIFFSKTAQQEVSALVCDDENDISKLSVFDSNYYCRPLNDKFQIENLYRQGGEPVYEVYSLPAWQAKYGFDANSRITGTQISPYTLNGFIGNNKFANGSFNTDVSNATTWSPSGVCHTAWANGEKLDGGAMKVYFDGPSDPVTTAQSAYLIMYVGSVDANKQYVLRFSLQGTKNQKSFQIYLRKEGDPYNELLRPQFCNFSTSRTENEFLISFPESQPNASIIFEVSKDDSTFYVDNLQFLEANISATNPDDYIRFEYNASAVSRTVDLNGIQYVDPKNNVFSGNLTLAPWSSIILIKTSFTVLPVKFSEFTGQMLQKQVQLNWHTTPAPSGSHYEIERSPNISFTKIGSVDADRYILPGIYQFTDPVPLPGKNYYRIKEVELDGPVTYSNIILINNAVSNDFTVWPNPAAANIFVALPKVLANKQVVLTIETSTGAVLMKKQVTYSGLPISVDVSLYSKGIYLVRVSDKDESYTSPFIKQ